jgi:hypothetical protein
LNTGYQDILINILKNELVYVNVEGFYDLSQVDNFRRTIAKLQFLIADYDFVIVMRNDTLIYDYFINLFDPFAQKVMFPFVHPRQIRMLDEKLQISKLPVVSDIIFYFPRKYFFLLEFINQIPSAHNLHYILPIMKQKCDSIEYDFYLKTYHDSNTEYEWNPLYRIMGRPKTKNTPSGFIIKYPEGY